MLKKILAALFMLVAATAYAAVDANTATQAELESIKGIGPVVSTLIVSERKKSAFKDWNDMVERVKGVGEKSAAKFSAEGLTVNGAAYPGAPAATRARGDAPAKASTTASKAASASAAGAKKAAAAEHGAENTASAAKKAGEAKEAAGDKKGAAVDGAKDAKAERAAKRGTKAASAP